MSSKKSPAHPYTAEHLASVRGYVDKWKTVLNLADWRIGVRQGRHPDMAMLEKVSFDGRVCRITMGRDAGETITAHLLEQLVVHELLHLMLHDVKAFAIANGDPLAEDVLAAEHRVINILEVLLCPAPVVPPLSNPEQ